MIPLIFLGAAMMAYGVRKELTKRKGGDTPQKIEANAGPLPSEKRDNSNGDGGSPGDVDPSHPAKVEVNPALDGI